MLILIKTKRKKTYITHTLKHMQFYDSIRCANFINFHSVFCIATQMTVNSLCMYWSFCIFKNPARRKEEGFLG